MRTTSIMTTSWTTKADAGDAEGRVTAAHKTLILRQHHKKKADKKPKKLKTSGLVLNHIHIQFMKNYSSTLGFGMSEHKPTDSVEDVWH